MLRINFGHKLNSLLIKAFSFSLPLLGGAGGGLLLGCRGDDFLIVSEETDLGVKPENADFIGMYVLNQGNMGSNRCTLDYLDLSLDNGTIRYFKNIYAERNPQEVKELGDVGNDLKIYGSQLWMTINCSNKVEVCRASDATKLAKIDIPNCRYLAFHKQYAYVTSYVGPVEVSGDAPLGCVYKIDTLSHSIVDKVTVGYQPDEMAVIGDFMFVANSGGYRVPHYDNRVSVIDLDKFEVIGNIEVAPNLYRCRADKYGQLWVSSRGDYFGSEPQLYCITNPTLLSRPATDDAHSGGVFDIMKISSSGNGGDRVGISVSALDIVGDTLFYVGSAFNYNTMATEQSIGMVNVRTHLPMESTIFDAPEIKNIEMLYGIKVNPVDKDFYLMDAKNYVSSGELLHFKADGTFDWKVKTGDIPAEAAFVTK